jgi:hypothetical protein
METLVTDGITYTKASVLAKRFHYTSDYIGQLCRSGKATCQLVGRSWYVDENSLLEHKESRYKEIRLSEKTIKNKPESESETITKVYPRPDAKDVRREMKRDLHAFSSVPMSIATYLDDSAELLPQPLRKISPVIPVAVTLESSKHIDVRASEVGVTDLSFTDMPEVALTGNILIHNAEFEDEGDIEPVTETDLSPEPPVVAPVVTHEIAHPLPFEEKLARQTNFSHHAKVTFSPAIITNTSAQTNWLAFAVVVLSACALCSFFVLSSHEILVGRFDVSSRVVLTTSALSAVGTFLH